MQTKIHSFIESCVNVIIGYSVALGSQIVIYPIFDIDVNMSDQATIALLFTIISLIRSYLLRRFFTHKTEGEK